MKLHVVSFDVPWPANYGGVIDVYNRLEALNEAGIKVILHAFHYGRDRASHLESICEEVHYYRRKNRMINLFGKDPMIVISRSVKRLLTQLTKDDYPILFEGQHTTSFINHPLLAGRKRFVRIHNVEHEYYRLLSYATGNVGKRRYYRSESKKLRKHESLLAVADQLFCITEKDTNYYNKLFHNATYLPVAIKCETNDRFSIKNYALYHGNLSVDENIRAVDWLLDEVCNKIDIDFIIAGKDPAQSMVEKISRKSNVQLVDTPADEQMKKLLLEARAHVFYTNQATGIKLKLLNALCTSSPIICNETMVQGTGLSEACIIADKSSEFASALKEVFNSEDALLKNERSSLLSAYSYNSHVQKLMGFLQ